MQLDCASLAGYKGHKGIGAWISRWWCRVQKTNLKNVGVCIEHWPPDYPTKSSINGRKLPSNITNRTTSVKERKIDFESRQVQERYASCEETSHVGPSNVISNWSSLIEYVKTLPLHLKEEEGDFCVSKLEGMPPQYTQFRSPKSLK